MAYHQFSIHLPGHFHETISRLLMNRGCLGIIEQPDGLVAYFPLTTDPDEIIRELNIWESLLRKQKKSGFSFTFEHAVLPDSDWNEYWKRGFRPMDVGEKFTIMPPWNRIYGDRIPLIIDPGMAFGTGHHETTRSCIILIERYADVVPNRRFLDLGTGTGLLAIVALKLGFKEVEGIDTDPLAIEAAQRNIEENDAKKIRLREGSLAPTDGSYDFIAANLISGTLIALARDIADHLADGGHAVLSGILHGQQDEVINAMRSSGLTLVEQLCDGKWVSLVVKH